MAIRKSISSALLVLVSLLLTTNFHVVEGNYRQKRIVGGHAAPIPPVDDPLVFVEKDDFFGSLIGSRDPKTGYYQFKGIRYAEPPVGSRRFQRSVPVYLEGDLNATEWGPPCPQPGPNGKIIGSEDCLFLNVFTPSLPDATEGYPVIIWLHGGNFRRGAANQYEMRNLVEKKTVVVSVQYRLGSLGFLSTGTKDLPGNNGLFDQILAVEWVRNYIEFFGGNPNKITIAGQGTGASSAYLLGLSKFGNSYFSGIIAMSGSLLSHFAVDKDPMKSAKAMAEEYNCPLNDTVEMVYCLRELPFEKIVEQDNKHESFLKKAKNFITDLSTLLSPGPVVEGKNDLRSLPNFVTDEPENSFNIDMLPEIPLLTGVIKDETGGAVYGPFKDSVNKALQALPDFLTRDLVPNLQRVVPTIGSVTRQFVPEAFNKYLNPFINGKVSSKAIGGIAKVTEALNDALFNAPAFLTVKNWPKKSKAFLYSFDHTSKQGFGKDFLDGLPLVGDSAANGKTSHGDDLGYVFEPNTIYGEPMPQKNLDPEDDQVKEIYTDMIANFARSGEVQIKMKSKESESELFSLPSFTGSDDDSYLSISAKPEIGKQFRFCEMGLWTGIEERFKSAACSLFFVDINEPLRTFEKSASAIVDNVPIFARAGSVSDFLNVSSPLAGPLSPPIDLPIDIPKVPIDLPTIPENPLPAPNLPVGPELLPVNPLSNRPSQRPYTRRPTNQRGTRPTRAPLPIPKSPFTFG